MIPKWTDTEARNDYFHNYAAHVAAGVWIGSSIGEGMKGGTETVDEVFEGATEIGERLDFVQDLEDRVIVALRLDKDYRFLVTMDLGTHPDGEEYIYRTDVSYWEET